MPLLAATANESLDLKQARHLRNLARFPDALVKYREVQSREDSVRIRIDIASMLLQHGCSVEACEELVASRALFAAADRHDCLLAEMLLCWSMADTTAQFSCNLSRASALYEAHLEALAPEAYTKFHFSMACSYMLLVNMATLRGINTTRCSLPSLDFLRRLLHAGLNQRLWWIAYTLSGLYAWRATVSYKMTLYDRVAAHVKMVLSETGEMGHQEEMELMLVQAAISLEQGDWLRQRGKLREARTSAVEAQKLFQKAEHATGADMASLLLMNIDHPKTQRQRQQALEFLTSLKSKLIGLKNYTDAITVFTALCDLAIHQRDGALLLQLDMEMRQRAALHGDSLLWLLQCALMLKRWERIGAVNGQMIMAYEAMYSEMEGKEVPFIRDSIANNLAEAYLSVGNTRKAEEWHGRPDEAAEPLPRCAQFLHGKDPFYRALQGLQALPDHDLQDEVRDLETEIQSMKDCTDPEQVLEDMLNYGIMKLMNICDTYMNQVSFRGHENTQRLAGVCLESAGHFVNILPEHDKNRWRARIAQCTARLLFIEACRLAVPDTVRLEEAIKEYCNAARLFRKAGEPYQAAIAMQNLGICYRTKWSLLEGASRTSPLFGQAVECFEAAGYEIQRRDTINSQRLNRILLLQLWNEGAWTGVEYGSIRPFWRWTGLGLLYRAGACLGIWRYLPGPVCARWFWFFTTPIEETIMMLGETEHLINMERHDLSALTPWQDALIAKQQLRQDKNVQSTYHIGTALFNAINDGKRLWEWIQRAKARSVSDMLAIGANIPPALRSRIAVDPGALSLLAREAQLVARVRKLAGIDQFFIRRELDQLRAEMRAFAPLAELLDMREGKPVTWAQLHALGDRDRQRPAVKGSERTTWFIDWFFIGDSVFLLIVPDTDESYHVVQPSPTTGGDKIIGLANIEAWCLEYLDGVAFPLDEDEESLVALRELRSLVAPIVELTAEGDQLVFCPAGPLHRVPLHAVVIEGELEDQDKSKWKTLIERNPIVFTSSMTIYAQNMTRVLERLEEQGEQTAQPISGSVIAVYEDPDPRCPSDTAWVEERDEIYAASRSLADSMGWLPAQCGLDVRSSTLAAAITGETDIVLFHGHFQSESGSVLDHGVRLGPGPGLAPEMSQPTKQLTSGDTEAFARGRLFTVSDLFDHGGAQAPPRPGTRAKHAMMIACGTARQHVVQGDEPLGFVTGLLHTGTTSVTGTIWKVPSHAGRSFTDRFFEALREQLINAPGQGQNRATMDLAVALQRAVSGMRLAGGMNPGKFGDTSAPYNWAGFVLHGCWYL